MNEKQKEKLSAIKKVLRGMSLNNNYRWGKLGEQFAKVNDKKELIPSLTGTAKYRIPDILTDTQLMEVKNVCYQRLTNQIRDFMLFCSITKRNLVLYLRDDARLSSGIINLHETGKLEVRRLGYLTTQAAQEKLRKALEPIIVKALKSS